MKRTNEYLKAPFKIKRKQRTNLRARDRNLGISFLLIRRSKGRETAACRSHATSKRNQVASGREQRNVAFGNKPRTGWTGWGGLRRSTSLTGRSNGLIFRTKAQRDRRLPLLQSTFIVGVSNRDQRRSIRSSAPRCRPRGTKRRPPRAAKPIDLKTELEQKKSQ